MTDRSEPDMSPDEPTALREFLQYYRDTLERKTTGLTDAQAATASCPPSMLTLTGLVRHMAEVERHWFRRVFRSEDAGPIYYTDDRPDGDLDLVDEHTSLSESLGDWRDEIAVADEVLASVTDLGQIAAVLRHDSQVNMRWILVHMIEEYARHCGHADLIRERIDGATGD